MTAAMTFESYDELGVYTESTKRARLPETKNFVVEFGKSKAEIAFDVGFEDIKTLLDTPRPADQPVRWINLWDPHAQQDIVDLLGKHYEFSKRLLAIMKTESPGSKAKTRNKHGRTLKEMLHWNKQDVEAGVVSVDTSDSSEEKLPRGVPLDKAEAPKIHLSNSISHYALAEKMPNYHSIDVDDHYMCLGANFIHEPKSKSERANVELKLEGILDGRLWSWLVLCDDYTVISIHEHPGQVDDIRDLESFRYNTLSVLGQLSEHGYRHANPMDMQTIRGALKRDVGIEGSSLLLYYLFDDWQTVFTTVTLYSERLRQFDQAILFDMWKKSYQTPDVEIIPRLHRLGRHGRQLSHLYSGYKSLIQGILDPKVISIYTPNTRSSTDLSSMNGHSMSGHHTGVMLAKSASQRFERLSGRLELLIIEQMKESLAERDALVQTYFNITAQKDSEATARLTRAATLLAKLSVLFLPVSLMTGYFSIQVSDLVGVYTVQDYWYAFAGIMSVSFLALFFFSKLLMWITEGLEGWMKIIWHSINNFCKGCVNRKTKQRVQ